MGGHRPIASHEPIPHRTRPCSLRRPLSVSAGNIKHPVLASNGDYHDTKGSVPLLDKKTPCAGRDEPCTNCEMGYGVNCSYQALQMQDMGYNWMAMDRGAYGMGVGRASHPQFTVPSQRAGRYMRKAVRSRKSRNPIADSVQYLAYRSRQTKGGDDQKWNDLLEDLFLEAIIAIPKMGRRKVSFGGKPHGRNELISQYLWIGYKYSLPRGAIPDEKMKRTRKQVSSHIQVLKAFMKDDPQSHILFPPKNTPANGFEESFKDNKTLMALAEGRLPSRDFDDDAEDPQPLHLKPSSFEMFVSASDGEFSPSVRIHDYSTLSSPPLNGRKESIDLVRDLFPQLAVLEDADALPSCIIHLNVGISLMKQRPDGAELNTRVFLQLNAHPQTEWRTVTTLTKPKCLSGPYDVDPPIYQQKDGADYLQEENGTVKLHVPFPANPWAHAFIHLIDLLDDTLLETITMYQEICSKTGPGPFTRRAILLWTFHKSANPAGETSWNYVGPPDRNQVFSPGIDEPQPHNPHSIHSVLHDSFSSWDDHTLNTHLGQNLLSDPFIQSPYDHRTQPAPLLRSPFNPQPQFPYSYSPQSQMQHMHNADSQLSMHNDTSQALSSQSTTMSQGSDSATTLVGFEDGSQGALDIQLSYETGHGLEEFGTGEDARHTYLMTPTPGVGEGFDAGVGWSYDGLEHVGVGVGGGIGMGVNGCWDEGDLVGFVGHQDQGNMSIGPS